MAENTTQPATPIGGGTPPNPPTTNPAIPISVGGGGTPPTTAPAQPIGGVAATAPRITSQPSSQTITENNACNFTVIAIGTPPFTYIWQKDGVTLVDDEFHIGATTNSLTLPRAQSSQAGAYRVRIENAFGDTTSDNALLTVTASSGVPPTIVFQPQSRTVTQGGSTTFSCLANGSAPFTYQWHKEGIPIAGATDNFFTLNNAQPSDEGLYTCIVTNPFGSAPTNQAALTVTTPVTLPIYLGNAGPNAPTSYTEAQIKALQQTFPQVNPVNRSQVTGTYEISAPPGGQNEYRVIAIPSSLIHSALQFFSAGAPLPMTETPEASVNQMPYKVFRTTGRSAGDFTIQGQTAINIS